MDKKFLEEGARILNEIIRYNSEFNDWTVNDKKIAIKVIAETLDFLSSKHKDDVRALREAIEKQKTGRVIDNGHDCYDPGCDYCADMAHDSALVSGLIAFDSTLKERGICL